MTRQIICTRSWKVAPWCSTFKTFVIDFGQKRYCFIWWWWPFAIQYNVKFSTWTTVWCPRKVDTGKPSVFARLTPDEFKDDIIFWLKSFQTVIWLICGIYSQTNVTKVALYPLKNCKSFSCFNNKNFTSYKIRSKYWVKLGRCLLNLLTFKMNA